MKTIRKYLLHYILITSLLPQSGNAQIPTWHWAKSAVGTGNANDFSNSVAVDKNGNSYITGNYGSPTISFGSTTLQNTGSFFAAKYDASGSALWAKNSIGNQFDNGYDIAVDDMGNAYITGSFASDSIKFGNITLYNSSNSGAADVFIVKYDDMGNALWAKSGKGKSSGDTGWGIVVDEHRNCYITGGFYSDSIRFDNKVLINNSGGIEADIFIVKYDQFGNTIWAKSAGGARYDIGTNIAVDPVGNIFITGQFTDTITLGSTMLINNNSYGFFIAKYDSLGNVLWAKCEGGTSHSFDTAFGIAVDGIGNPYITGFFYSDSITIGGSTLMNVNNISEPDIFIAKYDSLGNVLWAKSAGGRYSDYSYGIAVDKSGNAYITGTFSDSSIQFGTVNLVKNGIGSAIFVAKYNSYGDVDWARNPEGDGVGMGIAIDYGNMQESSNGCFVTGLFSINCVFDSTTLISNNGMDIFLAKLGTAFPSAISENSFSETIHIFPNPTQENIHIASDIKLTNATLHIDNLMGETLKHVKNLSGQKFVIECGALPKGIYLLLIMENNKKIATKKLVITD